LEEGNKRRIDLYILYVAKICILTLLKISYVFGSCFAGLLTIMSLIRAIKGDKAVFTKLLLKIKEELYGINFRHCK
jgi:hypothetical protein